MVAPKKPLSFIDELLADQQQLDTPVARFSSAHSATALNGASPAAPSVYRDQIPLTAPRAGEQYAFEVDLESCTGCKACVSACHSLNGLDDGETWRDTGLLVSPDARHPFTQTVTTACHHCVDPACLNGCPVLAYEKDPLTGIVRHLDDQCIGCSYCVLMCPYDVPKYNEARGIVRKCDMCHGRLSEGEAPACVSACPTQAIRIVTVTTHVNGELRIDTSAFLATAPDPGHTLPTTRYLTKRPLPEALLAADHAVLHPQPSHWPLVVMLTLLPAAVGLQLVATLPPLVGACLQAISPASAIASKLAPTLDTAQLLLLAAVFGAAGLSASVFHLGQPLRAWRVFLGWRKSWLSREALVFGTWLALTITDLILHSAFGIRSSSVPIATAALGLLGLFCSVMIYVDTRRSFWRFASTAPRFFGSAILLGLAGSLVTPGAPRSLNFILAVATLLKLLIESRALAPLNGDPDAPPPPGLKTARLLTGKTLRPVNELRVAAAGLGGILLPLMIATASVPARAAWLALAFTLLGELAERSLFFRAVVAPKMPGVNHT